MMNVAVAPETEHKLLPDPWPILGTLKDLEVNCSLLQSHAIQRMGRAEYVGSQPLHGMTCHRIDGPINPNLHPPNARAGLGYITIASIHHLPLYKQIDELTFEIPPTPKGHVTVFRVYDSLCFQLNRAGASEDNQGFGSSSNPTYITMPLHSPLMAGELIKSVNADGLAGRAGFPPGVMIIPGDLPTLVEVQRLKAMHMAFCQYHIRAADSTPADQMRTINRTHRFALEWSGDMNPVRHPWHKEIKLGDSKPCPNGCGGSLPVEGNYCRECRTTLDEWYVARGREPNPDTDPHVWAGVQALKKAQGGGTTVSSPIIPQSPSDAEHPLLHMNATKVQQELKSPTPPPPPVIPIFDPSTGNELEGLEELSAIPSTPPSPPTGVKPPVVPPATKRKRGPR